MRWEGGKQGLGHQREGVMSRYIVNNNDNPRIMGRNGSKKCIHSWMRQREDTTGGTSER